MADKSTFFFYDLETSGRSARNARIMQFGGQRTDRELNPIGEPVNVMIKLTPDILPEPEAILITGITPQQSITDGLTEAEFLKYFYKEIVKPDTIFIGYNNVRFDDEFINYLNYRNFYDAYEWRWKDNCSRWDLLDVVRMMRALRPDGILWPFSPEGKPTNRLEYLSSVNKLAHANAHDALSDVLATIDIARLVRSKQPELFNYLLSCRGKQAVKDLVLQGAPFVYTSGRYPSQYLHTTAATLLAKHPKQESALVYDLRFDPTPFADMSVSELVKAWRFSRDPGAIRLPVKTLKYNRCPAAAPLGVMKDKASQERLQLPLGTITDNFERLNKCREPLAKKVMDAIQQLDDERERTQTTLVDNQLTVDERLYDSFLSGKDKAAMRAVRAAQPGELAHLAADFQDEHLKNLLPLYKARNYPGALTSEERSSWDAFCVKKLLSGGNNSRLAQYFKRLEELQATKLNDQQKYLLEELRLYGESIVPADVAG